MQRKRATGQAKVLPRQVAGHFLMGACLGTAGAFALIVNDTNAE
jgi:hypothetical protein